jgi:hypothetical protein
LLLNWKSIMCGRKGVCRTGLKNLPSVITLQTENLHCLNLWGLTFQERANSWRRIRLFEDFNIRYTLYVIIFTRGLGHGRMFYGGKKGNK